MTYDFGDIILVDFPFSSNIGSKKRPAVIISSKDFNAKRQDLVLLAITSQINNLSFGEALISDWKSAGLLKPSAFKSVIFTIENEHVNKLIGKLTELDKETLKGCLKQVIVS